MNEYELLVMFKEAKLQLDDKVRDKIMTSQNPGFLAHMFIDWHHSHYPSIPVASESLFMDFLVGLFDVTFA